MSPSRAHANKDPPCLSWLSELFQRGYGHAVKANVTGKSVLASWHEKLLSLKADVWPFAPVLLTFPHPSVQGDFKFWQVLTIMFHDNRSEFGFLITCILIQVTHSIDGAPSLAYQTRRVDCDFIVADAFAIEHGKRGAKAVDCCWLALYFIEPTNRYFGWEKLRFVRDADGKVIDLLLSFYEEHPIEWQVSGWKNNAIADLMERDRNTAELWLKKYWKIRQREEAKMANQYSDKRSAAQSAVLELEILDSADTNPIFLIPGRVQLTAFVNWLNKNYDRLAQTRKGKALVALAVEEFRRKYRKSKLSDRDFEDLCAVYSELEGSYKR